MIVSLMETADNNKKTTPNIKKMKYENMDNRYVTCSDYDNDLRVVSMFCGRQCASKSKPKVPIYLSN